MSTLWSQADNSVRSAIANAHLEAVRVAIDYLQDTSAFSRRGSRGVRVEPACLVVATFEHGTSRELDPQLHTHALILNMGVRADGSTGKLVALPLFLAKMTAGALYRAELASRIEAAHGVSIRAKNGWFEIVGVPEDLNAHFSKRRNAMDAEISRMGVSTAVGAARIAIETRQSKNHVSRESLFDRWKDCAKRFGWSHEQANGLIRGPRVLRPDINSAVSAALTQLMTENAHFSKAELVRTLAEKAQGRSMNAQTIFGVARQVLEESPDVVKLGIRSKTPRYTLASGIKSEESLFADCASLLNRRSHAVRRRFTDHFRLEIGNFTEEQKRAVQNLVSKTGDLAVLNGTTGSGKTRVLSAAARIWRAEGYDVTGLTVRRKSATELMQEGSFPCSVISGSREDIKRPWFTIKWNSRDKHLYFDPKPS